MKRKQVETKIINGVTYLRCTKCAEWKELNEENFYKDKNNKNIGFKSQCKECKKVYYQDNKENRGAYQKEYNNKHKDYYKSYIKEYNKNGYSNIKVSDFKNSNIEKLIKYDGDVNINGRKFTRLAGGFSKDSIIITTKQIGELLNIKNYHVVEVINNNIKHFTEDYIRDLKVIVEDDNNSFSYEDIGYTKMMWSKSKNVYILSEAGFLLYLKFADGDKAVELYKDFIEDYFKTKVELSIAENTLQNSKEELLKEKTYLIGQSVMCNNEMEQIKIMRRIESISNQITEIEKTLTKQEVEEKYKAIGTVADMFLSRDNCYTMNDLCKVLDIKGYGRNNMFKYLRNKKVLRNNNTPYQRFVNKFKVIENKNQKGYINPQTLVNGEGVKYIVKLLQEDNIIKEVDLEEINEKLKNIA